MKQLIIKDAIVPIQSKKHDPYITFIHFNFLQNIIVDIPIIDKIEIPIK